MQQDVSDTSQHTKVIFSSDARKELYEGVLLAAEAVGCTLGPRGKCVLIHKPGLAPITTKDGVTVSKAINLDDPVKQMGVELIKVAASQTNDSAGDGTTTATVLTHAMVREGMKLLEAGIPSTKLVEGINIAIEHVVAELKRISIAINTSEQIVQIGTISANGDRRVGSIIADAMDKVGRDGIITVEDAKGMSTSLEVVEGMQFDRGYLSPYFVTNNDKMLAVYNDAYILVTDRNLTSLKELIPVLEHVHKSQKALFIIADNVEGEALQALVLNRLKTDLKVVAVKAPGYGQHRLELLNDICTLTGATLVSATTGVSIESMTMKELGTCKRLIVDAKSSTIVGDGRYKEVTDNYVAELKEQMNNVTLDADDLARLRVRIAKLGGGVAIIKVGGMTELEMVERKYRIEDALHATRAAADEGIVPGGGSALAHAAKSIDWSSSDPEIVAAKGIVKAACLAPLRKIVMNAGGAPDVVINELMKHDSDHNVGYDAMKGEFVDMYKSGVIDPCKVTRVAIQSAASVATTFLTLDAVIYSGDSHDADSRH